MPATCAVAGCKRKQGDSDCHFHRFPANGARRQMWMNILSLTNISNRAVVCSNHFEAASYSPFFPTRLFYHALPVTDIPNSNNSSAHLFFNQTSANSGDPLSDEYDIKPDISKIELVSVPNDQELLNSDVLEELRHENTIFRCSIPYDDHSYILKSSLTLKDDYDKLVEKCARLERALKTSKQKTNRLVRKVGDLEESVATLKKQVKNSNAKMAMVDKIDNLLLNMLHNRNKKSEGYPDDVKKFAITLHFYSARAYEFLTNYLPLPHPRTIRKWASNLTGNSGLSSEALAKIKREVDGAERTVFVALMFEEMAIRKETDSETKTLTDHFNLGEKEVPITNDALVFYCKALNATWKYSLGYTVVSELDVTAKKDLLLHYIEKMQEETGTIVSTFTSDGTGTNIEILQQLGVGVGSNLKCWFKNPTFENRRIYCFLDPAQMVKLFRKQLAEVGTLLNKNGDLINFQYLIELTDLQDTEGLQSTNKLLQRQIAFRTPKLRAEISAQTLSNSVANALLWCKDFGLHNFQNVEATVELIRTVDSTFDLLNSINLFAKGPNAAIQKSTESVTRKQIQDAILYFEGLMLNTGQLLMDSARKLPVIGFILCMRSLQELASELVWPENSELEFLRTRNISHCFGVPMCLQPSYVNKGRNKRSRQS